MTAISLTLPEPVDAAALAKLVTIELRPLPGVDAAAGRTLTDADFDVKVMERADRSAPAQYVLDLHDPIPGGTRALATGSDISGAGTVTVSGATVTANVVLSLVGGTAVVISAGVLSFSAGAQAVPSLVLSGGTLTGTAAVTVTGRFDATVSGSVLRSVALTTQGQTTVNTPSTNGFLAIVGATSWTNTGTLTIAGARYRYTKTLWITGLADRLPLYESVDAAVAARRAGTGEAAAASQS